MAEPWAQQNSQPEWDQLSIETPELVAIDMPVAGLGSRFAALLVDYLIWLVVIVAIVIVVFLVDPSLGRFNAVGQKWATALEILIPFLFMWGYFTLFEAFWDGRTPGKRMAGIRVIQRSGRGIGLFESMTRNLLRIVDQFPLIYVVGSISIFVTRDHQRLGDLAAGTLVVHDRGQRTDLTSAASTRTFTSGLFAPVDSASRPRPVTFTAAGAQRLGAVDLEVLEGFFARRLDFSLETRAQLAEKIAAGIRAKSGLQAPEGMSTETFLEELARALRDLQRLG